MAMYYYYYNQGFVNCLFVVICQNSNCLKGVLLIAFFYGSEVAKKPAVGEQCGWYLNYVLW